MADDHPSCSALVRVGLWLSATICVRCHIGGNRPVPVSKRLAMVTRWFVRRRRAVVAAAVSVLLLVPAFLTWEAHHAIRQARDRNASAPNSRATIRPLDRPIPPNVEPIGAQAVFRDAARFQGHVFAAGPHGLVEYNTDGAVVRRFRTGLELPPSGIVALSVGVLAAASEPELLIATAAEGLLTFDGRRMLHVRPARPEERKLTALLGLSSGRLLLGTAKAGVLVFDGRQLTSAHPELADVAVTALAGVDGDVWIGTLDRGVWHWHAGGVDRFDETSGLPDRRVLSIATHGDRTYVGTALGVAEFDGGHYARTLGPGLFAAAVAVRHDGLLIGTLDGTLAEVPLDTRPSRGARTILHDAPAPIQRFVMADGALYALADEGLYSIDDRTRGLRRVIGAEPGGLTDRNVSALAVDATGRLWVGYFDRGLDVLSAQGERAIHVENDHVFCVNRIVHDAAGAMTAVATANGLVLFDATGRPKQVLGRAEGLIADHVTDLVLNAGGMTVATPAGLTFIDREGSRSLYAFHGLVNNHVYALGAAGSEVLAGTLGGVSMLDHGIIHASYTTANSPLTHNWITAVARVDDEWFVGTYGGGLFRLDATGRWQRFADLTGPIEVNPNAIAVTDTHVFAGTLSNGLLAFDRRSRRWTTVETGLPSTNVTALVADRGHLYVGTDNGLVRIRP
jgi:ligand-binding sensor domain-containing protein